MKNLSKILFLFGIIVFMAFSCDENENNSIPVEFKLRVLNEQGVETTTFNEGENVIFSFLVTNQTNEDLYFYQGQMNLNDFFSLIKLNTSDEDLLLGKPYNLIFCDKIGALKIPANGSLDITVPWLYDSNISLGYNGCEATEGEYHTNTLPLSVGNYKSEFSSSFKISEYQTEEKYFEVKFTIK